MLKLIERILIGTATLGFYSGVVNLFMFSLPRFFWVEIKYRNYPDFIEAYEAKMTHFNDSVLVKNAEIEYEKMILNESK